MKINQKNVIIFFSLIINFFSNEKVWSQEVMPLPPIQQERILEIDIEHIAIDLQFDWKTKQAFGTTKILFSTLQTTSKIHLDAGKLVINSIKLVNGTPLQFNYDGSDTDNALEIVLDKTYTTATNLAICIDYHTNWINEIDPNTLGGNNGKGIRFTTPTMNDPIKKREIWSFSDADSNRFWFPSYDAPNDLRTTDFTATVDSDLYVISNGILINKKLNSNGTVTFNYKTKDPYPNHLTAFAIGEFTQVEQKVNKIAIQNFGYSEQKKWVEATVEQLPKMMEFYSKNTGFDYPHRKYSQVFVQDIGTYSSNASFSTITENMIDDFETHADYYYLWDLTESEALAQQWFGNCIYPKSWSDFWLTKSLAHSFSTQYNEFRNGKEEFLLYQHGFDQNTYMSDWKSGYKRPVATSNFDSNSSHINDNYTSIRGALVLQMLRKEIGDKKWKKSIQNFVRSNKFKLVTTSDFIQSVEKEANQSMKWFFNQWIFQMGHPVFEVKKSFDASTQILTVTVKQNQKIEDKNAFPQTHFFQGKMEIEIDSALETIQILPKEVNSFAFQLKSEPKLINFDFESTWIKELIFEKSFEDYLYQFENSRDILAQQSALTELMRHCKNKATSLEDQYKVKQAITRVVLGNYYWRLRNTALSQLLVLKEEKPFDENDLATILACIEKEKSWTKANAIRLLGTTNNEKYADLYLSNLNDTSMRVVASAAVALGKTKSPKAFNALVQLMNKPSMKSQSRIAALNGLKELGDERGFEIAMNALTDLKLPRWRLATSNWDYRVFAAQLIASLGKSELAFPIIFEYFKNSLGENDIDGVFNNLFLINTLKYKKGQEAYTFAKEKYKNNPSLLNAIAVFEEQFNTN